MTKGRKIGISLAFALIFLLVCTCVIPLYGSNNANVASAAAPVITDNANTWENPYNGNYYAEFDNTNLTGAEFRTQLANLITSTHKHQTSYSELATVFKTSDADPNKPGNIIWFYTGTSVSFGGSFGSSVGSTNREHVWAKNGGDTFPPQSGPGADAHHLRPTEMQLNGFRSNFGFGVVPQTSSNLKNEAGKSDYGSSPDGLCYLGSVNGATLFYPAKGYRGATARILFYMQVRWGDANGLYFVDGASTSNGKGIGKITDLMKWHLEEPPTDQEIRRNEAVFGVQKNRNPFIDHPEYAEMIYCNGYDNNSSKLQNVVTQTGLSYLNGNVGGGGGTTPTPDPTIPTGLTLSKSTLSLEVGQTSTITVTATPSTASNSVTWSTSNASVATVTNGTVKAVGAGTATITATSTVNTNIKATLTVTVAEQELPPTLTGLTLSHSSLDLSIGGSQKITVSPIPSNAAYSVDWSTSDSGVATVNNGVVTAVGKGSATITATSRENSLIKATLTVTVVEQADMEGKFTEKMAALSSATTLEARYKAIAAAVSAYWQMSASDQAAHEADKAILEQAISAYNEEISKINEQFQEATNVAAQAIAKDVSMSLLALVLIVIKRTVGR